MSFLCGRAVIVHNLMEYLRYSLIAKKKSILSFFSAAKSQDSFENGEMIQIMPTRHTILATSFKDLMGIVGRREFPLQMLAP